MKQLTDRLEKEAQKQKQTENQTAKGTVLSLTKNGLETIIEIIGNDPYTIIKQLERKTPNQETPFAIIITCSGWASPLDRPDTRPSEHPARVRVHIATAKTITATASAITFADNRENQTTNEGAGELVDALDRALKHLHRKHKTHIQRTEPKA